VFQENPRAAQGKTPYQTHSGVHLYAVFFPRLERGDTFEQETTREKLCKL